MNGINVLVCIPLLLVLAGCGNKSAQQEPNSGRQTTSEQQPATKNPPGTAYTRMELIQRMVEADESFKNAPKNDPLERLAALQYATAHELLVVARALDSDGEYRTQIEESDKRLERDGGTTALGSRLNESMLGIYSSIALLYTLQFRRTPEKLEILKKIGKDVEDMMARNEPIIEPLRRLAEGNYQLIKLILEDIDRERTLTDSFARSDSLYRTGKRAAQSGEDRFLNAMYRTFEVGQIWALQVNPRETEKIGTLKDAFRSNLLACETIGDQMAVSMEYMYRVFHLVAMLTLDYLYPQDAPQ